MHFTSWRRRVTHIRLAVCWSEWMSLSKLHSKSKEAERDTERGESLKLITTPILLFQAYSYVNIETSTFSFWQSSTEHISSCCTLYWRCSYYRFYQRNLRYITLRWVVVNTVSKVCSTKFTKIQCVILIHYSHYQVSKCTLTITLINESNAKLFVFFSFLKKTEDLIPMIFQIFICIQSMNWKRIYEQPIKVKRWYSKMIEIKMCKTLIYHHVKVYIKLPFTPIFILFLICISYFFVLFYVFFYPMFYSLQC